MKRLIHLAAFTAMLSLLFACGSSKKVAQTSQPETPKSSGQIISEYAESAPKGVLRGFGTYEDTEEWFAYKAASAAMTEVYGIEPVPSRGGGSICVLAEMRNILRADPLLMGFGLERDTIHSPNESYLIRQFEAGMESIALFYEYWK